MRLQYPQYARCSHPVSLARLRIQLVLPRLGQPVGPVRFADVALLCPVCEISACWRDCARIAFPLVRFAQFTCGFVAPLRFCQFVVGFADLRSRLRQQPLRIRLHVTQRNLELFHDVGFATCRLVNGTGFVQTPAPCITARFRGSGPSQCPILPNQTRKTPPAHSECPILENHKILEYLSPSHVSVSPESDTEGRPDSNRSTIRSAFSRAARIRSSSAARCPST